MSSSESERGSGSEHGPEGVSGSERRRSPAREVGNESPPERGDLDPELRAHLRARRRAGDGWVETPRGKFWGLFGAAGLLIHDPDRGVLLQHRVHWSAHGGTWGIPGGAIDAGETPLTGAIRECHEEAAVPRFDGADIRLLDSHVVDMEGWTYTTVVARALEPLEERINDIESVELRWVPLDDVTDYPLHPGFASAWPALRAVLEDV